MAQETLQPTERLVHVSMNTGNPPMPPCEKCGASPVRQYLSTETGRSTSRCPMHDEYIDQLRG